MGNFNCSGLKEKLLIWRCKLFHRQIYHYFTFTELHECNASGMYRGCRKCDVWWKVVD